MKTRLNKHNRRAIETYAFNTLNKIAKEKGNRLSILDLWDTETAVEKEFNISDQASPKVVWKVMHEREKWLNGEYSNA
tara:strand:+ start:82 stop:315 length:234 start_codon:yes stop_codon:yes gene_type:complete